MANDEALLLGMALNRQLPATGAPIFGPFLVVGDAPPAFRTLAPLELERALDALAPELSQEQFTALMHELDGGCEWTEMWE